MTNKCPQVSVGLPVYNGEEYLVEALESLLEQDFTDFELIISDNASTDRTGEICREYARRDGRIRYFRNERNLGLAANFNRVFELSRGRYFKWTAHDDLCAPSCLRVCVETLDLAPARAVLCYPRTSLIDENGSVYGVHEDDLDVRGATPADRLGRLLSNCSSWCHPILGLIRTEALRQTRLLGAYGGADHVLLAELALQGEFLEIPEPLLSRRTRGGLSPSLQNQRTPEEMAAWFSGRARGRMALPHTRLLIEHIRAVRLAGLDRQARWACYQVLRTAEFGIHWSPRALWDDLAGALRRGTWERYSLTAIERAHCHYLPHRLWALLAGSRRADFGLIRLSLSQPSDQTHAALLQFVAERLSRRRDRRSRDLLDEWLVGPCEARRMAAALATRPGRSPRETSSNRK